jgi:hypothetical protein
MREIGPPITMPTVPAVTMKRAVGPSLATLFRSMEIIKRKRATGRKYRVVKSYAGELGGVSPRVVANMGTK